MSGLRTTVWNIVLILWILSDREVLVVEWRQVPVRLALSSWRHLYGDDQ